MICSPFFIIRTVKNDLVTQLVIEIQIVYNEEIFGLPVPVHKIGIAGVAGMVKLEHHRYERWFRKTGHIACQNE
jgi:hypothetical protein